MGCDIFFYVQVKTGRGWKTVDYKKLFGELPLNHRCYSCFVFLADMCNYDCCTPLFKPKGLPNDLNDDSIKEESYDMISASYFTLSELLNFDYDQTFENRRIEKQTGQNIWDGACIAEVGEGKIISYRENMGEGFFDSLKTLQTLGDNDCVRIVFFFDY